MTLFKKTKEVKQAGQTADPMEEILQLEIRTMPKKFLGLQPGRDKFGRSAGDGQSAKQADHPPASIKRNILIAVAVIVIVGAVLALVAYWLTSRIKQSSDNQPPVASEPPVAVAVPVSPAETAVTQPPIINLSLSPLPPKDLVFSNIQAESLRLSWTDVSDNEGGFRVYRHLSADQDTAELVGTTGPNIVSYTLASLTCGTLYYFWVEAFAGELSSISQVAVNTTQACPQPVTQPLPAAAQDIDRDLLSAPEEELFGTEPNVADSDQDGFLDGDEVINLFDPRFGNGAKLSDSNRIRSYVTNEYNYRLLVPTGWSESLSSQASGQVRFTSASKHFFEVLVEPNTDGYETARAWYLGQFPSVSGADLTEVVGQNITGVTSPDGLTSYFATPDYIYILNYNPGLSQNLDYLATYRMFVVSFSFFTNPLPSF